MNFTKENPYPEYDFVSNDLLFKQEQALDQYGEYGEINQERLCKKFMKSSLTKNYFVENTVNGYTAQEEKQHFNRTVIQLYMMIFGIQAFDGPTQRGLHTDITVSVFYNIKK